MTRKEMYKKVEEHHQQTMTIQEVLDIIEKRIDEAYEKLDGSDYAYGRMQALEDIHHEFFWNGIDMA